MIVADLAVYSYQAIFSTDGPYPKNRDQFKSFHFGADFSPKKLAKDQKNSHIKLFFHSQDM
jgi:hypothetical protein